MTSPVPVRPGDVLRLREDDYRYGRGPMVLRVTALIDVRQLSDGPWLFLAGVELHANGAPLGQRAILVRMAALRRPRHRTD